VPLIALAFLFSGCFQIYLDIVANPDGTFVLRKTVGFGKSVLREFYDMKKAFVQNDSSAFSDREIIDSMRESFTVDSVRRSDGRSVIGLHGITSFRTYDKTLDTLVLFTTEVGVAHVDSLAGAYHTLMYELKSKDSSTTSEDNGDDITMQASWNADGVTLRFHSEKDGPMDLAGLDAPLARDFFKSASMHIRVFAPQLKPTRDKHVKTIPGGQDWALYFSDILKKKVKPTVDASFTLLNR
jgi:hypothetical protein